jgi:hypothetical protein
MKGEWIETRAGVSRSGIIEAEGRRIKNQHGPNRAADLMR